VSWLSAAPTVLIALRTPRGGAPGGWRGVNVRDGGRAAGGRAIERMEGEFGWEVTQVYGLTETSPFITICEPPEQPPARPSTGRDQGQDGWLELITSGDLRG